MTIRAPRRLHCVGTPGFEYQSISREMLKLSLMCSGLSQGDESPDKEELFRKTLANYGEGLWHWIHQDFTFPGERDGVENMRHYHVPIYVKRRTNNLETAGGFNSLMEIAEILKMAGNPDLFDRHTKNLDTFFNECYLFAEELSQITGAGEDIIQVCTTEGRNA